MSRKSSTDTSVNQEVSKSDRDNYLQKVTMLFKASDPPSSGQEDEKPLHAVERVVSVREKRQVRVFSQVAWLGGE